MRYKYVALRKDIPIRGLELLQSLDRDLFHLLQTVIGNERLLKGINFRLHGIDTRQKMLLKLYEQILENIYRIKGDQTQAHHILSKIEDLLEEEGTQIISSSNNGILRIYFYDSKDNSFFIIAPSFDEEHVSELFLKSLGQILDRYIARTFKNLSPGQHDYIKKCIEFITNNYFNSGFIAGKAMREGWNSLIHALQHLNDHLGDKSLWDYINILQKRNILLVPFFKIAFDSPKGRSDLVKTIDAIVTAINIIPIEILQKSP